MSDAEPTTVRAQLTRLYAHNAWADARMVAALAACDEPPADGVREFAHLVAAESVWLARIDGVPAGHAVWPAWSMVEAHAHARRVHDGWARVLASLDEAALLRGVTYTNSAGETFTTPLVDILLHVALHGQYHRGKINVALRGAGAEPASSDYIFWVRGVPAARS
ncbi:MAG: DinB family protein [Gemmatimonadaceae bacterium]|nr:DinB family protein [Gemmatimonadaceae bacterium]